jgi:heat-inducible transcriptional repressor
VAKKSDLRLSSATIRNIMMDLEEQGFLTQPHPSAGRVPTAAAFRYYVNHFLGNDNLGRDTQMQIEEGFVPPATELPNLLRQASRILSAVSGHPAIVRSPRIASILLKHIQFISLGGKKILVVLVTRDGMVQNRFLEGEEELSQEQLDKFSRYLNELCKDLSLVEARQRVLAEIQEERILFDNILSSVLTLSQKALQEADNGQLYIEGASKILAYPEFSEIEKIKGLYRAFEEKHNLIKLLDRSLEAQGIQIFISSEMQFSDLELSLVTYNYRRELSPVGTLGVIGPMRMDYARVIPMVKYTATMVSNLLDKWRV